MLNTIRYAKDVYYNRKREWNKIIDRGMAMDFSWKNSAKNMSSCMTECKKYKLFEFTLEFYYGIG